MGRPWKRSYSNRGVNKRGQWLLWYGSGGGIVSVSNAAKIANIVMTGAKEG